MNNNPTNSNGPEAANNRPAKDQTKYASNSIASTALGKAVSTQIATLALAGHHVHKGTAGDFTVSKWGLSRYCENFAELQAFALKLGVRS